MRQIYISLGLEGTALILRDADTGEEKVRMEGATLATMADLLRQLEEQLSIVRRRGIDFARMLAFRAEHGRLPQHLLLVNGEQRLLSAEERLAFLRDEAGGVNVKDYELHEVRDLERIIADLGANGLPIEDYFLTQEESVSGEKLPTKYALEQDGKIHDVAGVGQILEAIYDLGKQGIEVQRFKGLGEMNPEQLWETTLDPSRRMLLRVTLEEAGEAERLFSVLMGEDVERRRQFIEDHALEVKNLDV